MCRRVMEEEMISIQISEERYLTLRPGLLADYHKHGRIRTTNELSRVVGPVTAAEVCFAANRLCDEGMLQRGSGVRQMSERQDGSAR